MASHMAATWLEMAAINTPGQPARAAHPIEGDALLVYRGDKVYVAIKQPAIAADLLQGADVRRLAANEAQNLEKRLPGQGEVRLLDLGSVTAGQSHRTQDLLLG